MKEANTCKLSRSVRPFVDRLPKGASHALGLVSIGIQDGRYLRAVPPLIHAKGPRSRQLGKAPKPCSASQFRVTADPVDFVSLLRGTSTACSSRRWRPPSVIAARWQELQPPGVGGGTAQVLYEYSPYSYCTRIFTHRALTHPDVREQFPPSNASCCASAQRVLRLQRKRTVYRWSRSVEFLCSNPRHRRVTTLVDRAT